LEYRAEIDGLRALAVLPVIFFHAGFEFFGGGFVGVDVFFVISGYLITGIILSEINNGQFSIINFYERRARRILPALFFVMASCLPFAWYWLTPSDLKDFGQSLIAVSTFSSNILFWMESGYFDTAAELKPLLHTWSLAVEEQYYILFPIFLMISWRLGINWIIIVLIFIFLISLSMSHWGAFNKPSASFFLLPTRAWELLIGVFVAFYLKYYSHLKSFLANQILSLLGFTMIIYSIVIFDKATPFPSLYALVPTIGTALLVFSSVPKTIIHSFLSIKPIVFIGLISYSAYLWHQPLLAFARHRLLGETSDILLLSLCILSIFMAWISWRYIEQPFRNKKITSKSFIFTFSIFGIIVFLLVGSFFQSDEGLKSRVKFSNELSNSLKMPALGNCFDTEFIHSSKDWGCYLGADKSEIDFVFFGDSHSLSLKSLMNSLAKSKNIKVFYTGASGCPPFLGIYPMRNDQKVRDCNMLNKRVYKFAKENDVKGLILSARWTYYNLGDYEFAGGQLISASKDGPFSIEKSIEAFRQAFNFTVNEYLHLSIPIHLITQHPHQKYSPKAAYFSISNGTGSLESFSVKQEDFNKLNKIPMNVILNRAKDIHIYDVTDLFCENNLCMIGTKDQSYYYDDNHLSEFGAQKLLGVLNKILIHEHQ
jgi:peptidoglycan/LPS O-acetylase OafA/YrhL